MDKIKSDILLQVITQPLVSSAELAKVLGLDEGLVKKAVRALQRKGLLRTVSFGCLMRPTARYWVDPVNLDGAPGEAFERNLLSWHSDDGIGCLLRYDMPRVETVNQVAARYATDGWVLEGVAWVERDVVQAIALYHRRGAPEIRSTVSFVWVGLLDTDQEIWERLADLPAAVSGITRSGLSGSIALVGDDRWAVARALPLAVERLSAWQVEPADVAAWTYAEGWQAASGASILKGAAGQPFRPTLAPARLDSFVWPRSQRRLGRTRLASVIESCPWTRRDAHTLYRLLNLVAEHPGGSIAHYAALLGRSDKDRLVWRGMRVLLELGLIREAGTASVANLPAPKRAKLFSERGQGQMRYRISLSPKVEKILVELAELETKLATGQGGESTEELRKELEQKLEELKEALGKKLKSLNTLAKLAVGQAEESGRKGRRPMANGADRLKLNHGYLSYTEIVLRSGLGKLADRLVERLVHDDILVDLMGLFSLSAWEVAPTSRAFTFTLEGEEIKSDAVVNCSSPVGNGHHLFEMERSHTGPKAIKARLKRYARRFISYPLLVVCVTDKGARNFDRKGQELGVPVVATSLPRLKEMGLAGPAWLYHGQEVSVTPVTCPPQPAAP